MIKALVVDDELECRNFLVEVLRRTPLDIRADSASTIAEAAAYIKANEPDVVFLDIMMDGEDGFSLFSRVPQINFEVIFTTAHNEFAVKAFKFNALDYLLKPVDIEELEAALLKVQKRIAEKASRTTPQQIANVVESMRQPIKPFEKIAIPSSNGFLLVPLTEIIFCESDGNYTNFILSGNRKLISSYTLKQYDEILTPQNFFRAHKSHLVNIDHVTKYVKGEGGTLVMSNGMEIEVSRRNKEELMRILRTGH